MGLPLFNVGKGELGKLFTFARQTVKYNPMAYQHDVFISYRRDPLAEEWVHGEFLRLFITHLREAVGGRAINVFIDKQSIEEGDAWPQRLKNGLARSRCMVSILMPSYFHSEWCTREFAVMENRSRQLGMWTNEEPGGLIVPICISDGEFFPETAKTLQARSFHDYFRVGSGFRNLDPYQNFQAEIIEWVQKVAKAIDRAPKDWNPEWLTEDWLDKVPVNHILQSEPEIPQIRMRL